MRNFIRCGVLIFSLMPFSTFAQPVQPPAARSLKVLEDLPPDVAFARQLAFLRADLLIAAALVKERDWVDALPHAQFPREEIYGVIREDLRTYKVPAFDGELRRLASAIHARSVKSYQRALAKIDAALAAADMSLKARQPDWPRFTLQVANTALARAVEEYDLAVTNGRVVRPEGYQSARGLVFEADRMIGTVAEALTAKDASAAQSLRERMAGLKQTFAPLAAPKQAPMEPAALSALVDDIQKSATQL